MCLRRCFFAVVFFVCVCVDILGCAVECVRVFCVCGYFMCVYVRVDILCVNMCVWIFILYMCVWIFCMYVDMCINFFFYVFVYMYVCEGIFCMYISEWVFVRIFVRIFVHVCV